jgi:predicted  nucleic acid-binding Zn-ribbon protein
MANPKPNKANNTKITKETKAKKETKASKTKSAKKAVEEPKDNIIDNTISEVIIDSNKKPLIDSDKQFDLSIRQKLISLYNLQTIDSKIDRINIIRGELPYEVQDNEDDVARLQTRLDNSLQEINELVTSIKDFHNYIKSCEMLIEKYKEQLNSVRNNREFDSINKEINYQVLEIKLTNKQIDNTTGAKEQKESQLEELKHTLEERKKDLEQKKLELSIIVAETELDEKKLKKEREEVIKVIDERLLYSYSRLRKNAKNGLAIVSIERDACGGCFNQIPAQRQMEIKQHKKIIVCEYCGRVIIDDFIQKQLEQE